MPGVTTSKLTDDQLSLRSMEIADIAGVHALSQGERWPHRIEDLTAMLALGQGVICEKDGRIVGSTMWWRCGPHFATLGMVIVSDQCRGAGVGRRMMNAALDDLGDSGVLLNATVAGTPLYEKTGFVAVSEIHQHQGIVSAPAFSDAPEVERHIRAVDPHEHADVIGMVESATGLIRPRLLADILADSEAIVIADGDEILGFAPRRRFGFGYSIGPVVARDRDAAMAMIAHWLSRSSGEFVRLDIHGDTELGPWLASFGLVLVGTVATMIRGTPPVQTGPFRSFSIVTQALG